MIGRIYKIIHSQSDVVYIGMTTNTLTKRWSSHKSAYIKDKPEISIYSLMQLHGINQFKILLIKEYEVVDKKHLKVYETLWINKLKCINKIASFNPMAKKQRCQSYYQSNRENRCEKVRAYAAAHKDVIKERTKAYREKNKELIKKKKSETFECECGGSWNKGHGFKRHERTTKHQTWLNKN